MELAVFSFSLFLRAYFHIKFVQSIEKLLLRNWRVFLDLSNEFIYILLFIPIASIFCLIPGQHLCFAELRKVIFMRAILCYEVRHTARPQYSVRASRTSVSRSSSPSSTHTVSVYRPAGRRISVYCSSSRRPKGLVRLAYTTVT